jgi:polysaccharide export outer membrane protein
MTRVWITCALLAAAVASGAAQSAGKAGKGEQGHADPAYVIGVADVLDVVFWRDKDLSAEVVVRPDGKITLPLLNEVEAGGLTPEQLRQSILERARRFIEEPTASVIVKQINSRQVFILGEVAKPGTYPLAGRATVLQLIATAGGLTEFAARDEIVVLRNLGGAPQRHRVSYDAVVKGRDLTQNLELAAGDTIVVP